MFSTIVLRLVYVLAFRGWGLRGVFDTRKYAFLTRLFVLINGHPRDAAMHSVIYIDLHSIYDIPRLLMIFVVIICMVVICVRYLR